MSDVVVSPNMGMPVPIVSQAPGPDWGLDYNSCLSILDQHNHAMGSGVPISQSGISLSPGATTFDSLGFNNSNAFDLRSVRFSPQSAALGLATDVGCLYEAGVDLYYNDGSGNQIRLTQGGSIVGTAGSITGLPSGTASASFAAGTFVWQSATLTAANMDAGSYIFRNATASSKGLTLSPPNAMAVNYQLFLPSIPAATSFLTLDTSGNIAASVPVDPGQQVSSDCGNFSTSSSSFVDVTNLSVSLTTSGRPVMLMITGTSTNPLSTITAFNNSSVNTVTAQIQILRGATVVYLTEMSVTGAAHALSLEIPASITSLDVVGAGTYTYKVQAKATSGAGASINLLFCVLAAYELK